MAENGRILTTHVGSLPRPQDVVDVVFAEDKGEDVDPQEYERVIGAAVKDRVQHQVDAGVDVVSDGEMSKIGYATFIRHRLSGFEVGDVPRATPADLDAYPSFRDRLAAAGDTAKYLRPICRGPITYENREPLERDLEHLRSAIEGQPIEGAFSFGFAPPLVCIQRQSTREAIFSDRRWTSVLRQYSPAASPPRTSKAVSIDESSQFQLRSPDRQSTK